MTEETKNTPVKAKNTPVKKKTSKPKPTTSSKVTLNPEFSQRVKKVCDVTGLSLQAVVQSLIEGPLARVEEGGAIVINASTGEVTIGAPPPSIDARFGAAPNPLNPTPPPGRGRGMVSTEELGNHRGRPRPGEGRTMDMRGE